MAHTAQRRILAAAKVSKLENGRQTPHLGVTSTLAVSPGETPLPGPRRSLP